MINSKIQWTDHTWNVAVGCEKVDADCKFCYMYRGSLDGKRYNPREIRKTTSVFRLPLKIKEPSKIFTSSLTDALHPAIDPWRHEMWEIIQACPHHIFQILTKHPERIMDQIPWQWKIHGIPPNVWFGTSVGHPDGMHRIEKLCATNAPVRFLSLEPLHGNVWPFMPIDYADGSPCIEWVIVGGESGNDRGKYGYRECRIEWIESIINECRAAGVPVFVKQLGTHLAKKLGLKDRHGGDISEWPAHLQIREFPNE